MPSKYTPRLSIEITEDQQRRLQALIPWGQKQLLFSTIIDGLIDLIDKYGQTMIAIIISKKVTVAELIDYFDNKEEK